MSSIVVVHVRLFINTTLIVHRVALAKCTIVVHHILARIFLSPRSERDERVLIPVKLFDASVVRLLTVGVLNARSRQQVGYCA